MTLYWYLGIGALSFLAGFSSPTNSRSLVESTEADLIHAADPRRNRWWWKLMNDIVAPMLAAVMVRYMYGPSRSTGKPTSIGARRPKNEEPAKEVRGIQRPSAETVDAAAEIETTEMVVDPMGAAPRMPFHAHLNTAFGMPSSNRPGGRSTHGHSLRPGLWSGDARKSGMGMSSCAEKRSACTFSPAGVLSTKTANRRRLMLGAIIRRHRRVCYRIQQLPGEGFPRHSSTRRRSLPTTPSAHRRSGCTIQSQRSRQIAGMRTPILEQQRRLGQRFALWIATDGMGPTNSLSATARRCASRQPAIGTGIKKLLPHLTRVTEVTYNHRKVCEAVPPTAVAIHGQDGPRADEIRQTIVQRFQYDLTPSVDDSTDLPTTNAARTQCPRRGVRSSQ